jgi:hypothetical protein
MGLVTFILTPLLFHVLDLIYMQVTVNFLGEHHSFSNALSNQWLQIQHTAVRKKPFPQKSRLSMTWSALLKPNPIFHLLSSPHSRLRPLRPQNHLASPAQFSHEASLFPGYNPWF